MKPFDNLGSVDHNVPYSKLNGDSKKKGLNWNAYSVAGLAAVLAFVGWLFFWPVRDALEFNGKVCCLYTFFDIAGLQFVLGGSGAERRLSGYGDCVL